MIGEIIDRAVSWFAPASAARRAHARNVYRGVTGSGYEAGRASRSHNAWLPSNRSPDAELSATADSVRARARDLVRNNAYARGILNAIVRNVVGCGIRPQSRTMSGEEPNRVFNDVAEMLFYRWSKNCDIAGRLNFTEMQRAIIREVREAGECLIQFVESSDPLRPIPLALEMIDCDRIASDRLFPRGRNDQTGNAVRRGIEVDAQGRAVAYWIYSEHPNDITTTEWKATRIPAENILHLFHQERIGQTRGVSSFAHVIWWLKNLGYYVENEMQASAVSSCFTVAIKTVDAGLSGSLADAVDEENSDRAGNQFEYLQPGMVPRLLPGEDVAVINPTRNATQSGEWINLMLRSMAVGTGLSFERLSRDYSRTNFSSNRASDLEDRREFRAEQEWLIAHFCEPVWRRVLTSAVLAGLDGFPEGGEFLANFDDWCEHVWLAPGWEWVDPQKEATASQVALASNLTTLADELASRGRDLTDTLRQRAYEKKLLDEFGLKEAQPLGSTQPNETKDDEDKPDEDEDEDYVEKESQVSA
jgi:lambda family phage portal protein